MSPKRKNNSPPVSLFAFQDIITCITGIMLLVVIIFLLNLINSNVAKLPSNSLKTADVMLDKELAEIKKQEEQIAAISASDLKESHNINIFKKKIGELKKKIAKIDNEKDILEKEAKTVAEQITKSKIKNKKINTKVSLAKKEIEIKKNEQEQIKKKLQEAQNNSLFNITSASDKSPIFVICGADKIRVVAAKDKKILLFEDTNSNMQEIIKKVGIFLQNRSQYKEFLSIMVTPEAAGYIRRLDTGSFECSYIPIAHFDIIQEIPGI